VAAPKSTSGTLFISFAEKGGVIYEISSQALKKKTAAPVTKEPEKKEEGPTQIDFRRARIEFPDLLSNFNRPVLRAKALKNKVVPPPAVRADPVEEKKESGPDQKDFRYGLVSFISLFAQLTSSLGIF
jgi:hypothetical protein